MENYMSVGNNLMLHAWLQRRLKGVRLSFQKTGTIPYIYEYTIYTKCFNLLNPSGFFTYHQV